jgi:hypothetical protein
MNNKNVQFYPYHVINEYMVPEYRQNVIHTVFIQLEKLSSSRRSTILNLVKRMINVPGFRNSSLAPLSLRIKGANKTFESNPDFVAQVLSAWCELNLDLAGQVYQLLRGRNWVLLPVEADRTKIPGFLMNWPEGESYEVINPAFTQSWPESKASEDDVRLMVVWLSGRLP